MNGLLEDGITLTQPDTPRPPFWKYMEQKEMQDWDNIPILRQSLTNKYNTLLPRIKEEELMRREEYERDMLMRRSEPPTGLLGEGDIPLPPNWGNLVDPEIGANDPKSRWYQFPEDQGLLNYGTDPNEASGWVDESGRYNAPMDYPKNAPNTPEHKQAYNFLRFNNLGGGI